MPGYPSWSPGGPPNTVPTPLPAPTPAATSAPADSGWAAGVLEVRAPTSTAEFAALLDRHLVELRLRGVDETVLAPIEGELRRYTASRQAG